MDQTTRHLPDDSQEPWNFDFGPYVPRLVYHFDSTTLPRAFARRRDLKECIGNEKVVEILLWLGFGIDDKEFEYLCAYFMEREFWSQTDVRGWFNDHWLDVVWTLEGEFFAMQCKQWNSWNISANSAKEICKKMIAATSKRGRLFLATINYLSNEAWDFVEKAGVEIWDYHTFVDLYDKYFFDPNAGWEEFESYMRRKKVAVIEKRQLEEFEQAEESKSKGRIRTLRESRQGQFEILREVRKTEAARCWISPNYVFSDKILWEMVAQRPRTKGDFLKIPGIGEAKYEKHCRVFAEAIRNFR